MPSCSISVPGPAGAVSAGHTTYGSRKRDPEDGFPQDPVTATAISFSFFFEHWTVDPSSDSVVVFVRGARRKHRCNARARNAISVARAKHWIRMKNKGKSYLRNLSRKGLGGKRWWNRSYDRKPTFRANAFTAYSANVCGGNVHVFTASAKARMGGKVAWSRDRKTSGSAKL